MTEQEVYAMALNEFKTKGEPEAGPAPPRRRLQVPRLDELCIAKIAANLSEWPLLDQVPQQYVSSIVRRVAPATIQLSRAAQQISSEVFWRHMSARWPLAEVAHHGSSYKRLFFENFLQERLEQYHASKSASTLQDVMADVEAARPSVHTVRLRQQRAHINLAHVFKGFFNLTTLDLVYGAPDVGMNFDPDLFGMKSKDASALSTMLLETRSLSNFYVRQSQVDDELLGLLMRGLTGNQTVTCLDLSHNRISNDGAVKLAEMLTHDSVLISLNLADNCISGEGGAALGHALSKNATLQELSLRLNDVGDQGGAALLRGLIDNNTLESLNLSCNGLGAHSQAALVDLIHHGNALTSIDVSGNDCVPEDDAGARLLQEVRDNAMISYLDLRENKSLSAAVDAEISALLYAREERIERTRRQNYFAERMPAH
ncbi:hypothetical protein PBRA_006465 [Plasmodiophora brassicae]|nr:hypothetical protein PBRA_006465 [Plasmodiophora brassicae]